MKQSMLRIGRILRPQGIKGEVKIQPLTDDVSRYEGLETVFLERDGGQVETKITVNRMDATAVYAYLEGCYSREGAEALRELYLCVPRAEAIELPENSWFIADLEGLVVKSETHDYGVLTEVIQTGGVDVYAVREQDGKQRLFPALKKVIQRVDLDGGTMWVNDVAMDEVSVRED